MMKLGHSIEDTRAKCGELTDAMLGELRVWGEEHGVTGIPDEQLAIFAHSCYYDVEATKSCMNWYYRLRASVPEFFSNRDMNTEYNQQARKVYMFATLPVPDDNGYRIIIHRLADTRSGSWDCNDAIKLFCMTVDASLYNEGCVPGYIILFDLRGVGIGHLTRLSITSVQRLFEYIQDGVPFRLKAIHVLNTVWFIDKVMAILRPFMKRELYEMIRFHSGDAAQICEHVPPRCLPKDYGGELESLATFDEEHDKKLDGLADYFRDEESLFRGWAKKKSEK